MRRMILILVWQLFVNICNGQILFYESFDNVPGSTAGGEGTYVFPNGWILANVDNRTPEAGIAFVKHAWERNREYKFNPTDTVVYSTSYYDPAGQADDWMWTPPITLYGDSLRLSWRAMVYDANYPDGYEVRIMAAPDVPTGTTGSLGNMVSNSTLLLSVAAEQANAWKNRTLNLDAYAGQTVRIAFRNHSNDKFLLLVDDVKVESVLSAVATNDGPVCRDNDVHLSVTPKGGVPPYSYSWTGPNSFASTDQNSTITNVTSSNAGEYTVVVTDSRSPVPASVSVKTNVIVNSLTSSETTVSVCNKYTWNGTEYKASGDYTWMGTNAAGCDSTATLHLTILSVTSTYSKTNVSCSGVNDGSITITPTYGVAPFTYRIGTVGAYGSSNTFTNLKAGRYRVSIFDANGCAGISDQIIIGQSSAIGLTLAKTNVTCFLKADGSITANVTGGTQPYQYRFGTAGTFGTTNRWTGLAPGLYSLWVKDANGCTASGSATVTQPGTPVSATFTKTDESCPNAKNGSIVVNATGGTSPYRYRLGTVGSFGTGNTFSNLKAGTYRVFVNDNNNCTGYSFGVVVGQTSPTCTLSTRSMVVKPEVPTLQQGLTILLSPNPSNSYFTLRVNVTEQSAVHIRVIDVNGRNLFTAKGLPEQPFKFGESFAPGVYLIEVRQGDEVKTVKAVKVR